MSDTPKTLKEIVEEIFAKRKAFSLTDFIPDNSIRRLKDLDAHQVTDTSPVQAANK